MNKWKVNSYLSSVLVPSGVSYAENIYRIALIRSVPSEFWDEIVNDHNWAIESIKIFIFLAEFRIFVDSKSCTVSWQIFSNRNISRDKQNIFKNCGMLRIRVWDRWCYIDGKSTTKLPFVVECVHVWGSDGFMVCIGVSTPPPLKSTTPSFLPSPPPPL